MKNLNVFKKSVYQKLLQVQGLRNLIFDIESVENDETRSEDVWVIFKNDTEQLEQYQSLSHLLFEIKFNPEKIIKTYELKHSTFYEILNRSDGKS